VIGIGNSLRGDDGMGTWLAELEDVLFLDDWLTPATDEPQLKAIGPAAAAELRIELCIELEPAECHCAVPGPLPRFARLLRLRLLALEVE
jgi:hypothetical protein